MLADVSPRSFPIFCPNSPPDFCFFETFAEAPLLASVPDEPAPSALLPPLEPEADETSISPSEVLLLPSSVTNFSEFSSLSIIKMNDN
mmetsp:Transcript_15406/g.28997  ORF Transcript_15406/g.28997 Transcript_15406/m.28997 type:complete len:88 (-) Transcript_15406:1203-1466(-)